MMALKCPSGTNEATGIARLDLERFQGACYSWKW